jgi:DNA invertase Pin-like site-specific DNA recombinase
MIIGYARTSTLNQTAGFEAQLRELEGVKCQKIFREQTSSVGVRAQLETTLEFMREGDVLVVTKVDRLARSVSHLMRIIQALERKDVGLRVLNLGMDTSTPTGKLMLTVLGGLAQFEREMMLERQREGVAKAEAAGKYKGRKPTPDVIRQEVIRLSGERMTKTAIADQLNIGEATAYRILVGVPKQESHSQKG